MTWKARRRSILRGAAVELGGTVLVRLLSLLRLVVIGRLFLPESYGAFTTALLVLAVPALFMEAGLRQYVVKVEKDRLEVAYGTALALSTGLSVLLALIVFLAAPPLGVAFGDPLLPAILILMAVGIFEIPLTLPSALWDRELRFGLAKVPELAGATVGITGLIGLQAVGVSPVLTLAWAYVAALAVRSALIWLLAPRIRPRLASSEARSQVRFAWPLVLAAGAGYVAARGDDLAVRLLYGNEALGLYALAFYGPALLQEIAWSVDRVTLPAMASLGDRKEMGEAFTTSVRLAAALAAPVGFTVAAFSRPITGFVFGEEWLPAWPMLSLFALAFALRASTGLNWGALALATDRTRAVAMGAVLAAAFLVVVGVPLIVVMGPVGGAVHTLLLVLLLAPVVRFPVVRAVLGDLSYLRAAVLPLVVSGVFAGASLILGSQDMKYGSGTAVAALVMAGAGLTLFGLDRSLREDLWDALGASG